MGNCFSCCDGEWREDSASPQPMPVRDPPVGRSIRWRRFSDQSPEGSCASFHSAPAATRGPRAPYLRRSLPFTGSGSSIGRNCHNPDHPDMSPYFNAWVLNPPIEVRIPATPPNSRHSHARTSSTSLAPAQHYKFKPKMSNAQVERRERNKRCWDDSQADLYGVSYEESEPGSFHTGRTQGTQGSYHTAHAREQSEHSSYHTTRTGATQSSHNTAPTARSQASQPRARMPSNLRTSQTSSGYWSSRG